MFIRFLASVPQILTSVLFVAGVSIERFLKRGTDGQWIAYVKGAPIQTGVKDINQLIDILVNHKSCPGNPDFPDEKHRSDSCSMTVDSTKVRCSECMTYRGTLRKRRYRTLNSASEVSRTDAESRTPLYQLSKEELLTRSRNIASSRKKEKQKNRRLIQKIQELIAKEAVEVPDNVSDICVEAANLNLDKLPADSPQRLFVEEQLKCLTAASASARRWHPMLIRWALLVHKKGKSAYRYIREAGLMCLPCERTLADYRCYNPLVSGVDNNVIKTIIKQYGEQDVFILIDEMSIQSGLTYSAATGELTGFVDAVDEDALLSSFVSTSLETLQEVERASHALCFMVRGYQSSLQAVVATYATHRLTAEQLYTRFWTVVARCVAGLKIRCCVSDEASTNCKFYKLHEDDFPSDPVTYRAINRFSTDSRVIYFASDTSHLVKTTWNCFEKSGSSPKSRRLVVSERFDKIIARKYCNLLVLLIITFLQAKKYMF